MMRLVVLFLTLLIPLGAVALDDTAVVGANDSVADKGVKTPGSNILDRLKGISNLNPADWGIRNGCISLAACKKYSFCRRSISSHRAERKEKSIAQITSRMSRYKERGFYSSLTW